MTTNGTSTGSVTLRWSPRLMQASLPADPLPPGRLLPKPETLQGLLATLAAAGPAAEQLSASAPQPPPRRRGPRGSLPLHTVPSGITHHSAVLLSSILAALNTVDGWHRYRLDLEERDGKASTPFWGDTPAAPLPVSSLYTPVHKGMQLRPGPGNVDWLAPPRMPQTSAELAEWNAYYRVRAPYITDRPPAGYEDDPWNAAVVDPGPVPQLLAYRALAATAPLASQHRKYGMAAEDLTPFVVADVAAMTSELDNAMNRLRDLYRTP